MPSPSDDSDAKERGADTIIDKDINRDVNKNVARDRNFFMRGVPPSYTQV